MKSKKMPFKVKFFITSALCVFVLFFYVDLVPAVGKKETTKVLTETICCAEAYVYGNVSIKKNNMGITETIHSLQNFPCLFYETAEGKRMIQNLDIWAYEIVAVDEDEYIERWEITDTYRLGFIKKTERHNHYKIYLNKEDTNELESGTE